MDSNSETLKSSLKLIQDFTSWRRTASTHSLANSSSQREEILEKSNDKLTVQTQPQIKKYLRLLRNGSMCFIHKKEEVAQTEKTNIVLENSKLEQIQQRYRTNSHVILKRDIDRQAMKSRLDDKVHLAQKKLEEMRQGFKRRVLQKQQIVKKREPLKSPKLLH